MSMELHGPQVLRREDNPEVHALLGLVGEPDRHPCADQHPIQHARRTNRVHG